MVDVVEGGRGAEREACRAGATRLGGDEHDPGARARAVDGAGGRTLQDLHRLDVVRVQVHRPVRYDRAFRLAELRRLTAPVVDAVEVRRGEGRVVHRHAVHDKERLVRPRMELTPRMLMNEPAPG